MDEERLQRALRYFEPQPPPRSSKWTLRMAVCGIFLGIMAISMEAARLAATLPQMAGAVPPLAVSSPPPPQPSLLLHDLSPRQEERATLPSSADVTLNRSSLPSSALAARTTAEAAKQLVEAEAATADTDGLSSAVRASIVII